MHLHLTCCSGEQGNKQLKEDKNEDHTQVHTINEEKQHVYTNNVITFDFQESIPESHDNQTHQIEVIFDTGATFSMMPGQFNFAWTNLTPCLHTIEGCFKGVGTDKDTHRWGNFTPS